MTTSPAGMSSVTTAWARRRSIVQTRTREHLHRLAEHVVSPARHAVTGRIGLRPAPGGFATPPFGDDERVVAVDGMELVVRSRNGQRRARLTTLRAAAAFVGVTAGAPAEVYTPSTPLDLDAPLIIDAGEALRLAAWFQLGDEALQRFAPDVPAQLWPEHFDLAITLDDVNYGASPGDHHSAEPYLYVGPAGGAPAADAFWNAPFGAMRTRDTVAGVDDAVAFFVEGRDRTRSTR